MDQVMHVIIKLRAADTTHHVYPLSFYAQIYKIVDERENEIKIEINNKTRAYAWFNKKCIERSL